ncbi:MAG: hypothetical protein KF810_06315 [Rhizobiaceae bacterium]|nr:hypothetical protein [Rhizobiaceae bacterium]
MQSAPKTTTTPAFDDTGKLSLDHINNRADPREYFSVLSKLDYRVPELAKPFFRRLIEVKRDEKGESATKVVDVGCSYGVNAALLKHDMSMDDLIQLYCNDAPDSRDVMLRRDRALFSEAADDDLSVVGLDIAQKAVAYAVDVGILDAGVATDLERNELSQSDRAAVDEPDMIISTGCVGYVTRTSLEPLVEAGQDNGVWMANFVLRMFDYDPVEEMMGSRGYVTEKLEGAYFPQRRFVSSNEHENVMENLHRRGLEPKPAEREGWYLAELHVSRPAAVAAQPLEAIFSP